MSLDSNRHVAIAERRVSAPLDLPLVPGGPVSVEATQGCSADVYFSRFVLYQLRTAYLSCIKDGVGERLINVNTSVLNNPAFRAAGWAPNAADIKRTYSPPIPTAVASEYFQAPRSAGLTGSGFGDEDDEGGMVTGGEGAMILSVRH